MKAYPRQDKNYFIVTEALEDLGFEQVVALKEFNPETGTQDRLNYVFRKDGELFQYVTMQNYNTIIYEIELKKLDANKLNCRMDKQLIE